MHTHFEFLKNTDAELPFTCASRGSLLHKVTQLTVTDKRTFSVLTLSMQADVGVQVTLINIYREDKKG